VRGFWVMLPGAILWGASFPLALAAAALVRRDLLMTAAVRVCLPGGQENLPFRK